MSEVTESTLEEGPADSLAGEIEAAFDGYGVDQDEQLATASGDDETGEKEHANAPDDGGGGEGEQGDSGAAGEIGDESGKPDEGPGSVTAPEHWAKEDKELFANAPDDIKQWMLDRHKAMEGDYTRKTQDIADFRKTWEPVQEMYAPYMDQLQQSGLTPQQHITNLVNADLMLNSDPVAGIQHVAQMYGIDLAQFTGDGEQRETNPELESLRAELNGLKGQIQSREQAEVSQRQNTIISEIEAFAEAKAEDGELAHPHFDAVMDDVMILARAERAAGREPRLSDLYDKACWSNTSVREQILESQRKAESKKAEEEARAKVKQAKKASKGVSGSPGGQTPVEELDLRESIERQFG